MATLNSSHALVVNGKVKFLAVFDEGTGVPQDLISGEFASAIGTTPTWIADPEQGFAANVTVNGAWLWSGFTHGIDDTSISMFARFNLQSTASWGGIIGLDYLGHGTTLYHHNSDHMAFDNTGGGGHETTTLPWVNSEWHNGLLTIDIAGDNISYFRDGSAGVDEAHTIGGTLADDDDITVGVGQWADNWCNGYVGLAAIFSPALTGAEALAFTADPYAIIGAAAAASRQNLTLLGVGS